MQASEAVSEARIFRRVDLHAPAVCCVEPNRQFFGQSLNLSEGGVLLELRDEPPPIGSDVAVSLSLTDFEPSVCRVAGVVVWSAAQQRRVGVEFSALEHDAVAVLRRFVESRDPMVWSEPDEAPTVLPHHIAVEMLPVIRRMAGTLARVSSVHADDLIGAGFVGLVEAWNSYRHDSGVPFEAFARIRIRGAIKDEIRAADPRKRRGRLLDGQFSHAWRTLTARLGRPPEYAEIAREMNITQKELEAHLVLHEATRSHLQVEDHMAEDASASPETLAVRVEQAALVDRAYRALPERLQRVLSMHYGDSMTLRAIAKVLGVSEARVCQLHADAVRKMRETCES